MGSSYCCEGYFSCYCVFFVHYGVLWLAGRQNAVSFGIVGADSSGCFADGTALGARFRLG
jgi:hypothetical protein